MISERMEERKGEGREEKKRRREEERKSHKRTFGGQRERKENIANALLSHFL